MSTASPITTSSLNVSMGARPNNYGVTHVYWSAPPTNVRWNQIKLVRSYTGTPLNPNDGTVIYTDANKNLIYKVATLNTGNVITTFTYSGGGYNEGLLNTVDYITYTGVKGWNESSHTTFSGATFDVTVSGPAVGNNGTVISVKLNCAGGGYTSGSTLYINKADIGYAATAGTNLGTNVADVLINITGVSSASTNSIKTITLDNSTTAPTPSITTTAISVVGLGNSHGKNALVDVSSGAAGATLRSGGSNYAVGDYIVVPASAIGTKVDSKQPNSSGPSANYHVYDSFGSNTATITNPAKTSVAVNSKANKTYYALFIQYYDNGLLYWSKLGETESILVKNTGMLDYLLTNLPEYYIGASQTNSGNDLTDFLSLFAFHIEQYKAQATNVFNTYDVNNVDEILLKQLLKEFGISYSDVRDITQARILLKNAIKIYMENGSTDGLATLIKAYTGYGVVLTSGKNQMQDFNSASFEDGIGAWFVVDSADFNDTYPTYKPVITTAGPVDSSSGTTISAFNDAYTNGPGQSFTGVNLVFGTTVVIVSSTANIKAGSAVAITSGTNVFSAGTVITSILSSTTFRINQITTSSASGVTIKVSTNMITGMGKVTPSTTTSRVMTVALRPKRVRASSTTTSGTTKLTFYGSSTLSTNEYLIHPSITPGTYITKIESSTVTLSQPTVGDIAINDEVWSSKSGADKVAASSVMLAVTPGIPYTFSAFANSGGYIGGADTAVIEPFLNWYDNKGNIINSTTVTPTVGTASSAIITVATSGIAVGMYVAGNNIAADTTVSSIGSGTVTLSTSPTGSVTLYPLTFSNTHHTTATINASSNKTWVPVVAQGTAPSGAYYAEPMIQIRDIATGIVSKSFYLDAAQFEKGIQITSATNSGTTATITTNFPHGFSANNWTGYSSTNYVTVTGIGAPYDGTFAIASVPNTTQLTYTMTTTPTVTNPSILSAYVSSNSVYEDAQLTYVTINAPRVNLITNPSLEGTVTLGTIGAFFTTSTTTATTSFLVNGDISSNVYVGSQSVKVVQSGSPTTMNLQPVTATQAISISANTTYTGSLWVKAATSCRVSLGATTYDTSLSSIQTYSNNFFTLEANTWTQVSVTFTSDPNAAYAVLSFASPDSTTTTYYIDAVLFEAAAGPLTYFDGSFDGFNSSDNRDSVWEGTANASRSHLYPNRVFNLGNIKTIMTDGIYFA